MKKLHILAIAVHPDDVELGCAGTLIKHAAKGQSVGIVDLTKGELGTRGTPELRILEANNAATVMGLQIRENCGMRDGFFKNDEEHQLQLIQYIRKFQPNIVIANALDDRHPDHGRAGKLIADACFLSGLTKIETFHEGKPQTAWRPKRVFHMIQDRTVDPTFIVDISGYMDLKMEAIKCYKSQFHQADSNEPLTYIATSAFLDQIRYRDALLGKKIGTDYAEGYVSLNIPGIDDFDCLILPELA